VISRTTSTPFPSFKLGAGKSVRLHTGQGTNSSTDLYWGKGWYVWNNTGDKAIIRDTWSKTGQLDWVEDVFGSSVPPPASS